MGAVQAQILRPAQGTRMALAQASVSTTSTSCNSRLGATLLSLLLLPISQALPTTEGQNWLARSTCVLDALAHGGVVDSEKFNQCMDCWRRSSDESLQTATSCLTSLPQFCKEDEAEDGALALFFVWIWTWIGRIGNGCKCGHCKSLRWTRLGSPNRIGWIDYGHLSYERAMNPVVLRALPIKGLI